MGTIISFVIPSFLTPEYLPHLPSTPLRIFVVSISFLLFLRSLSLPLLSSLSVLYSIFCVRRFYTTILSERINSEVMAAEAQHHKGDMALADEKFADDTNEKQPRGAVQSAADVALTKKILLKLDVR
jgi:hypothetical protein